jgi:hypothetical protein
MKLGAQVSVTVTNKTDRSTVIEILQRRGREFIQSAIAESEDTHAGALTIVCNAGIHPIPSDFVFGELYIASKGNLDFSSIETINAAYDQIIIRLHEKLMEKRWKEIYVFPFGHSTLAMNIKLAVYRTLRIETVDIFYFGNGEYGLLKRDTRKLLVE